jgi:hypothetical protein
MASPTGGAMGGAMKRRRVVLAALRRLVSLAATVVVSLLVLEMSLRLVHRLGYDSSLPYGMKAPGTSAVRLVPNFEGISRRGIKYQTNTIGFRDDQIDPSAKHVIFLGDSTTFGLNIAHDDTYPEIFEGQLAADGILCQSVNTASPGQGTFDELDTLRGLCSSGTLNVRAVVLGFFQNDLSGNMIYAGLRVSEYPDAFQPIACLRKTRTWITLSELWRAGRDRRAMIRVRERAIAPPLDERREYAKLPGFEVEWDWLSADEIRRSTQ